VNSILNRYKILKYVFIILYAIILFSSNAFSKGTLENTLIRQNFYIKAGNTVLTTGNPIPSDTYVKPVYGVIWLDTLPARPIEGNSEIYQLVPQNFGYFTYYFTNCANTFDTIFITAKDWVYFGDAGDNWQIEIWDISLTNQLGDSEAKISNIAPDSTVGFKVKIKVNENAKKNSAGSCIIKIRTNSSPANIYSGDNYRNYGGYSQITDFDDNETSYIKVIVPEIRITTPEDKANTIVPIIKISGTAINVSTGDTIELFTNNILQSITNITADSTWSGTVALNSIGDSITAKITDKFGNINYDTITISYFGIIITTPQNYYDTCQLPLNIYGTVANCMPGDSIGIYYKGTIYQDTVEVQSDYTWYGTSTLTDYNDTILIIIRDRYNRSDSIILIVNYYDTPTVRINEPITGYDTIVSSVKIKGRTYETDSGDTIELFVNGNYQTETNLLNYDGEFELIAQLVNETNFIVVKLTDQFNRTAYDTIIIYYFDELKISIISPVRTNNVYDTNVDLLTITGTTKNNRIGDSIYIYVNNELRDTFILQNVFDDSFVVNNLQIKPETNVILVKLVDRFKREAFDTIFVNYFGELKVKILEPENYYDTFANTIMITGTAEQCKVGDTVNIYYNNVLQTSVSVGADFRFFANVNLSTYSGEIKVVLIDKFNRTAIDTIIVNYFGELEVKIKQPDDKYTTSVEIITIAGTSENSDKNDTIEIFVNQQLNTRITLTQYSDNWSGTVLLANVNNQVVVKLTDKFNRTAYDTITVIYLNDPPELEIKEPINDTRVNKLPVKLVCEVRDNFDTPEQIEILYNQTIETGLVNNSGIAIIYLNNLISDSRNIIQIKARDKQGNEDSAELRIIYDITSPEINITSPIENEEIITNSFNLKGNIKDNFDTPIILVIQEKSGYYAEFTISPSTNGEFNLNIPLSDSDGYRYYTLSCTDVAGNTTIKEITIIYLPTLPPAVDYVKYTILEMYDTGNKILLEWKIFTQNLPIINTIAGYNIYREENSVLVKLNSGLVDHLTGGEYNGSFIVDCKANEEYKFMIETIDKFSRTSAKKSIEISGIGQPENIRIRGYTYPDTTLIRVLILNENAETTTQFDNYIATISIIKKGKGKFNSDTAIIRNSNAEFEYSTTENNLIIVEVSIINKKFKGFIFLRKYPEQIPVVLVGEEYKNSIGLIAVNSDDFDNHYNLYKLLIKNFENQFENEYISMERANAHISSISLFKPTINATGGNVITAHKYYVRDKQDREIHNLPKPIQIIITYNDKNNDGIIDGTEGQYNINETSLKMYYLNEQSEKWELLPDAVLDKENNYMSAEVTHFSIYSIIGTVLDTGITNVIVYPNPFKPGIDASHKYVTFDNIVPGTKLRIFNVVGQLISEAIAPAGAYQMRWDGKNDYGQNVASGVYLYLLEFNNQRKIGKIILVR